MTEELYERWIRGEVTVPYGSLRHMVLFYLWDRKRWLSYYETFVASPSSTQKAQMAYMNLVFPEKEKMDRAWREKALVHYRKYSKKLFGIKAGYRPGPVSQKPQRQVTLKVIDL